ncbi:hypothetical protein KSS87_006081 [Heliosperma pusillum]|nr:hypothetical protein KSS87_006081 [Heliosperma pusillum]
MAEHDEEDYMGDLSKFLVTEPSQSSKNPRKQPPKPINSSIQPSKKIPRSKINWQEQKRLEKERKQLEEDQETLENLTSAIPQSNIGFKMLKQMGYTPGLGLGKAGRVDPVKVEIRRSRAGIGGEDPAKARLRREKEKMEREMERAEREKRGEDELLEDFGVRQRMQWRVKRVVVCYHKAKAALAQLENREVMVVVEKEEDGDKAAEEEEEEVITEEDRGIVLVVRRAPSRVYRVGLGDFKGGARSKCWCEVMGGGGPGDLLELLVKLREEHCYCLFCGCQYESAEALLGNCPGITEDDH